MVIKMEEKLLEIKNLYVTYKGEKTVRAVNGINFSLDKKETVGLVGETGAGKTSTALAIMRLLSERTGSIPEGEINYKGENLLSKTKKQMRKIRGAQISMIFQDPMTSLNPVMTVGNQILESLVIHNDSGKSQKEMNDRVDELLALVGIQPNRKNDYPHEFSGGMKQRVVIAIALACAPELLIADEPTTALDVTIQAQVLAMMEDLKNRMDTSIILITHDMGVVAEICDKVAIMYAGEIVEQGKIEDIFEGKNHHPYTIGLFEAIPDLEGEQRRLNPIDGLMPDPSDLPSGCKFHPRCTHCMEKCKTSSPPIINQNGHSIMCHLYHEED
jgi:peptide/nickel transport system ATP-binding protein